jgi:hypothetical protein
MIWSVLRCMRSTMARIKSRRLGDKVCPFIMLVIPYFTHSFIPHNCVTYYMLHRPISTFFRYTDLLVIITFSLSFIHFIFLSRTPPQGSLFFAVDVLMSSTRSHSMVHPRHQLPCSRVHLQSCGTSVTLGHLLLSKSLDRIICWCLH